MKGLRGRGGKVLSLIAGVALGFLACDRNAGKLPIGGVAPVTGEAATLGISSRKGFELAVEEWNAQGGVLGQRIRLVFVDDKGDPAEGATAYSKLVEKDHVVGILGSLMSKVCLAGAPIAQRAGVPVISPTATHPRVTAVGDGIFRASYMDSTQGSVGARFAHGDLGARRAACLFDLGNDYPKGLAEAFRDRFTELGGQVEAFEGHPSGAADFRAQLTKLLQSRPEVLYVPDYYHDAALIARQARELGFRGSLLGGDGWDSPRLVEIGGTALEPAYFTNHFSPEEDKPGCRDFVKRYRARYHADPDGVAALSFDSGNLLLEAIRRAGTTRGTAIKETLARGEFQTISGPVRFDADRNPVKPIVLIEIKGGRQRFRTSVIP